MNKKPKQKHQTKENKQHLPKQLKHIVKRSFSEIMTIMKD